jgi:NADPH:quinone reductase-like Zn-dependent oxidoreductase
MKAAVFRRYGPPEVVRVEEAAKPVPQDNQVLVRVRATTVCTADWRARKADPFVIRLVFGLGRPKRVNILGMEFSGTVESVGQAVIRFRAGDEVFGGTGFKMGAHAEYIAAPERGLAIKPANMPFDEAAAVFFGGVSALYFLRKANIQPGQKALIYGASGSVGVFAVQLAKHFGAHVTGVSSTANLELVKSLGADEAIDYTKEDFSKDGPVYDIIFDTVGKSGYSRSLKALKRGGCYLQCAGPGRGFVSDLLSSNLGKLRAALTGAAKVVSGIVRPADGDQAFLKELIEARKLKTVIDRRYSLDEIAEAHRHAEAGHKKGHVVVVMPADARARL